MKKIITILALLLLIGTVFAAPSVTILQPNGGEALTSDFNIHFSIDNYSLVTSVQLDLRNSSGAFVGSIINDVNFYDAVGITCTSYNLSLNPFCYYVNDYLFSDGNYKIKLSCHGTSSEEDYSNYFLIDNTPPIIDYNFPSNNSWINPDNVLFSFDLSDATSGIDANSILVSVLGKDYNILDSEVKYNSLTGKLDFNASEIDFNNGQKYSLRIDVNDRAKNSDSLDLNFWVDKNAPIVIDFNSEKTTNKQKPDFNISATDQNGLSGLNKMYFSCDDSNWFEQNYASGTINDFNIIDSTYGCNSSDENKTIYFKVSDIAGNYSGVVDTNIYYDSTSPTTTITISDENWVKSWTSDLNWTSNSSVDYNISCSEENTKINIWVYKQGSLIDSNTDNSNFYLGNIVSNGDYNIVANCQDIVGNTDSNKQINFGIDANAPSNPSIDLPFFQNDLNILISWSDAKIFSDVNYFLWGKIHDDLNFNLIIGPTIDLNYLDINKNADKNYCYFVQTINLFGRDTNSNVVCVLIDQTPPIIGDGNLSASVSSNNVTLTFYATDTNGSGVKGYYVSKDKNVWYDTNKNSYLFSGLANGTYTFYVKATDNADNNSLDRNVSATVNVVVKKVGGSGGSSSGGRSVLPAPVDSDINMVISTEEVEDFDFNNDSNPQIESIDSGDQNQRLVGGLTEDTNQLSAATGAFSLIEFFQSSWISLLLFLLLVLFLLFFFIIKRRKKEGLESSGRILLENDTDDFSINYSKPKWAYNEKSNP